MIIYIFSTGGANHGKYKRKCRRSIVEVVWKCCGRV